jgi:hypothetical protein
MVTPLNLPSRGETGSWVSFKLLEKKYIFTQTKNFLRSEIKASSFEGGLRRMTYKIRRHILLIESKTKLSPTKKPSRNSKRLFKYFFVTDYFM